MKTNVSKGKITYYVFNNYTLLDSGVDSQYSERKEALRRVKVLIKNHLAEWKKGENFKFKNADDEYLWKIITSELSFKKLEKIYELVEKVYCIDLKSMVYVEKERKGGEA